MDGIETLRQVHNTWARGAGSSPTAYIEGEAKSKFLLSLISRVADFNDDIIELGCNVGRNLQCLHAAGYTSLSGIEINLEAINMGRATFDVRPKIYEGSIEQHILALPDFDVIFTLAVLEHIHPSSEWIFAEMAKKARYIITIEDEIHSSRWKWPRNYKRIFEHEGMTQIYTSACSVVEKLTPNFEARIFQKG